MKAFHVGKSFNIAFKETTTIDMDIPSGKISDCKDRTLQATTKSPNPAQMINYMAKCVEESVTDMIIKANEEIQFQAKLRHNLAENFENYTCADNNLPGSSPVRSEYWNHLRSFPRQVDVLLDRPASKVHVIKKFISPDECAAMEETSAERLHKATVADGKGGSKFSESRKARQAAIRIPWKEEESGNLLTKISRRVYDYTDHVLKLGIDEHGQEDLMSIQYEGRGIEDKEPDRYMPHCDGTCKGYPHRDGQRMATVVMYCTVPKIGGATNFRKAGLHVVPEEGSATFFSYIDPETFLTDNEFTEHSGCPVIEGEKKIVTQWIRRGVDSQNPWTSFNTLGIKTKELENQ